MRTRARLAFLSLAISVFVFGLKLTAYLLTGSIALKSDALETVVNVLAACVALLTIRYAERPADEDHPYGHGKIEHFSAAFEGGLVAIAALVILYDGMKSWLMPVPLGELGLGMAINAVAGAINGVFGVYLIRRGKELRSHALEADGQHVFSDCLTSVGLLAGLLIASWTGLIWLDGAIAVAVGLHLAWIGIGIVRRSGQALLDQEDPAFLASLARELGTDRPTEVIAIHEIRTLRAGPYLHIDGHFVVPEYLTVAQAHDRLESYHDQVLKRLGLTGEGEFHSHLDPCRRHYCRECAQPDCPIRAQPLISRRPLTLESITERVPDGLIN